MDRRQKKSREAIFQAASELLAEKDYHVITVQEIIDRADVGRATFYAHFETKDFLLQALCQKLFDHILDTDTALDCQFGDEENASVFLHILRHLKTDNQTLLRLLSSQNNELFLRYFKSQLKNVIRIRYADAGILTNASVPQDFLLDHITSSFVETVYWWLSQKKEAAPETIAAYFHAVITPIL